MSRKSKAQLALEARQDAAYGALSLEQQRKLDSRIYELKLEFEAAVETAVQEAIFYVAEDEAMEVGRKMAAIRKEFGEDAVDGALLNNRTSLDPNLNQNDDLPADIEAAEATHARLRAQEAAEARANQGLIPPAVIAETKRAFGIR